MNLKKYIVAGLLVTSIAWAGSKIQRQGIKTAAECIAAGSTAANCLPLHSQIYDSTHGQTLDQTVQYLDATSSIQNQLNSKQPSTLASGNILVGSAGGLATSVTMSSDATINNVGALTIANSAVSNAKMANMGASTLKGNATLGAAAPTDLTGSQVTLMLNTMVGDAGSGGNKGLVPAPSSGDTAASKFLKADGTWAVPAGGGGGSSTLSVSAKVANYTLASSDDVLTFDTTSGDLNLTLPGASAVSVKAYRVKNVGGSTLSLSLANVGNTIEGGSTISLTTLNSAATLVPDGGTKWFNFTPPMTQESIMDATCTGCTTTVIGSYKVFDFTSSGTFTVTSGGGYLNRLLVVGGGAGGGVSASSNASGGGGGGGVIYQVSGEGDEYIPTTYTVTVGAGGASATAGSNSVFGPEVALGGGVGGSEGSAGGTGGSGGGGPYDSTGGAGTASQGYAGGNGAGVIASTAAGGGGGGAGAAGSNATPANAGNGGAGRTFSIDGTSLSVGGGGGGSTPFGPQGTGGLGGGGAGNATIGVAGTANTGGGGGAGTSGAGGTGGSGRVMVRIRYQ